MKVEIQEVEDSSCWLVRVDVCELRFKSRAEAEAFAERLQARLDAPHPLPSSCREELSERP
ncbi:MAG TPA: hypothetical protein VER09_05285 [Pseudomonas sp.]|nr:hypothetical protein [Pseudomonas sp.]